MVTIEYIAGSAICAYRECQAVIAWATLRALGIDEPRRHHPRPGAIVEVATSPEIMECFAQRTGVEL